jgi:hypothetical protein
MAKNYTFVDYATQVYIAFVGLVVLGFHGRTLPPGRGCCWLTVWADLIHAIQLAADFL